MSALARDLGRPALLLGGLGYLLVLAASLIWLHMSPVLILVLTVGSIALVLLTLWPLLAVHALIMLLYVESVAVASERVTGTKVMGAVIMCSWLLSIAARRRMAVRFDMLFLFMGLFVLWCGFLIFTAINADEAIVRTLTFAQLAVAAMMFSSVVDTPGRVRGVYWAIVAWTFVSAAIAIGQYYMGLTTVAKGLVGNRNLLAMYINIAIVCAYLLHQETRNPLAKLALSSMLAVLFLGLALTLSRSGLIILSLTLLLLFYRVAKERRFLILAGSLALLCALTMLLPGAFWSRAGSIVPEVKRQEETLGLRVKLWKVGMKMIADRPITGVGPGNFVTASPRYARGVMPNKHLSAHNTYVSVTAETGIVGLLLFLTMHALALRSARVASEAGRRARDNNLVRTALAVEACLLIIMASGLTGSLEAAKYLWIFFGLAVALGQAALGEPLRGGGRQAEVGMATQSHP